MAEKMSPSAFSMTVMSLPTMPCTTNHPSLFASRELTQQIHSVGQQIARVYASANPSAQQPKYFRPGSGFFNTTVRSVVKRLDYQLVLGSIYPWDAQISCSRLNAWQLLSSLRPGAVIVIHERKWTPNMLRIVLPQLKTSGWTLTTLTELLQHAQARSQT